MSTLDHGPLRMLRKGPDFRYGARPPASESGVELVDPVRHAVEERVADLGHLVERAQEGVSGERYERHGAHCGDRRVAGRRVEQAELAEIVAGPELGDLAPTSRDPPL